MIFKIENNEFEVSDILHKTIGIRRKNNNLEKKIDSWLWKEYYIVVPEDNIISTYEHQKEDYSKRWSWKDCTLSYAEFMKYEMNNYANLYQQALDKYLKLSLLK